MHSTCPDAADAVVDLRVYRLAAVKKAAYRVAARTTVVITPRDEHHVVLSFRFPPGVDSVAAQERVRLFYEELLDQELREQVAEETASLRLLILAQAFSNADLVRRD